MLKSSCQKIVQFLNEDFNRSQYNMFWGAILSLVGHPLYWFISHHIIYEKHDSVFFRFSSSASSLLIIILLYLTGKFVKIKPFVTIFWYFWVMWILPITFTYIMFLNDVSKLWLVAETIMVFLVILFISNIVLILLILSFGLFFGYLFFDLYSEIQLQTTFQEILRIGTLMPLALLSGTLFLSKAKEGDFEKRKGNFLRSLAGSIAHELRNPLNSINVVAMQIESFSHEIKRNMIYKEDIKFLEKSINNKELIEKITNNSEISKNEKKMLSDYVSSITQSTKEANNIIDLVLSDMSEKSIDESEFIYLKPQEIVDIIQKYYQNLDSNLSKITFNLPDDKNCNNFYFKTMLDRFSFIFNNLIKNALYYSSSFPDFNIKIGFDQKKINNKIYNIIYFLDNGPGISPDKMDKLFKDFSTFSKKGGTGLGLAFCKKNMKIFDGDIICESKYGEGKQGWTKFSLLFPHPTEEDIIQTNLNSQKKKILLVDDHKINIIALKTKIEKSLPLMICDFANGGREAISKAEKNNYHLIIMDIQMPDIDGIEASRKIKKINKDVPILAATSLSYETFKTELKKRCSENDFTAYTNKTISSNILMRSITKLILDYDDDFAYLGSDKDKIYKVLEDKKIILADDQDLNRVMTKKILEKYKIICVEARNGSEIVTLYKESLDMLGKSSFDAIVTDINMPPFDGDDATVEIRRIEYKNTVAFHDKIPIIALSGDSSPSAILGYFNAEMNDYFVKGNNFENLIKILANFFIEDVIPEDFKSKENIKTSSENDEENLVLSDNFINNFSSEEKSRIIGLFIEDGNQIISKIKIDCAKDDQDALNSSIHSLKGIVANIGAKKLLNYIKNIEKIISSEDVKNIENLYKDLINELEKYRD
jgi:CheY-like chemotaxis protein/HPt (histidine-containing phosphotransfer) domain-containing protein